MQPPPLPLVQESTAILQFLLESVDDACEDFLKVAVLWTLWKLGRLLCQRWLPGARRWAPWVLVLALFPAVDEWADATADYSIGVQNIVRNAVGQPIKFAELDDEVNKAPLMVQAIDDYVEDSFKLLCVSSHAYMGWLLHTALQRQPHQSGVIARAAGAIVSI